MQRLWAWLAARIVAHRVLVIVAAVVLSIGLAFGTTRLDFATGQDSYLNSDDQVAIDNTAYQSLFGGEAILVLYQADPGGDALGLVSPQNQAALAGLERELSAIPGVLEVITPIDTLQWNQSLVTPRAPGDPTSSVAGGILLGAAARDPDPAGRQARQADAITTLGRINAAGAQQLDNPAWAQFLLLDNEGVIRTPLQPFFPVAPGTTPTMGNAINGQILVRLVGNQSIDQEGDAATAVADAVAEVQLDGFQPALVTGAPYLLQRINDYLQRGMLTLGAIAVAVMVALLFAVFRVRWRLVPLAVMLVGVIWTFGVLGFVGFELSLVTIAGLPILIGLGVEFAIQVHNRIEEEVAHHDVRAPFATALAHIGPALLVATVAAVIACLALQASRVPMIRQFGYLLALGIAVVFVAAIVLPVALLAVREHRRPTTEYHHQRIVERGIQVLGHLPQWSVIPLVVVAVGLFAAGGWAEDQTPIQTDPEQWVDQSSQVIANLNELRAKTGSSSELGVYLQDESRGVFTDEMGAFVTGFVATEFDRFPTTLQTVSSLPTVVGALLDVPGASTLAPTGADLTAAYGVAPAQIQRSVVAADGTAMNVLFQTGPSSLEAREAVVEDIRATVVPPPGITATPSGLAVVGVGLLDNLTANRLLLTYLAVGGVALWLLLRFLNVVKALVTLMPVLLAVGLAAVAVKVTGITVSPLTTVSGPLVIAICTEFCALIMFRHLEERRRGLSPEEAINVAAARTGRAFFASSLTTVGGFLVLVFAELPLLRDFGAIVAITIAIALLSAVVVLPPLLRWTDERGWIPAGRAADPLGVDLGDVPDPEPPPAAPGAGPSAAPPPTSPGPPVG